MIENEIEGISLFIDVYQGVLKPFWQQFSQFFKTLLLLKFVGIGKKMWNKRIWLFHFIIIALLAVLFQGCGYKAPPQYEEKEVRS